MLDNLISKEASIKEAITQIDSISGKTLFVVESSEKMIGTLTDGDIRRGLIKGATLTDTIMGLMSTKFKFIEQNTFSIDDINALRKNKIDYVPILSKDGRLLDIIDFKSVKSILPLEAVIMAGGLGTRLKPLTNTIPKPLIDIGGKPIIEYTIDRLVSFGIKKIYISVNYLKEQVMAYFGDGSIKGIKIEYIEENDRTGTLGSVTLVDNFSMNDILVMNCDLLTNINFEKFYLKYIQSNAEMAVATVPYKVSIPYGIVETEDSIIKSLIEKPTYTYYSNAGIYLINVKWLKDIPKKTIYNATELIEKLIEENETVVNFPISNYWLDIGKHSDLEKARNDIKDMDF